MTRITFLHQATVEAVSAHLNDKGDILLVDMGANRASYDPYRLPEIKSITPPKEGAPTKLQNQFIRVLQTIGYQRDKQHSAAAAGVVLKKADGDFWFFGMEGEIMHNPEPLLSIKL